DGTLKRDLLQQRSLTVVSSIAWSADGKTLITGSHLNGIILRDAESGARKRKLKDIGYGAFVLSPDSKTVAVRDNALKLYEVRTGKELHTLQDKDAISPGLVFTPDGKQVVVSVFGGKFVGVYNLKWFNTETGKETRTAEGLTITATPT